MGLVKIKRRLAEDGSPYRAAVAGRKAVATSCDPPVGCRFGAAKALPNDSSGKGFR